MGRNEIVIFETTIGKHINNALKEELDSGEPTVAKFATTTQHGAKQGEIKLW